MTSLSRSRTLFTMSSSRSLTLFQRAGNLVKKVVFGTEYVGMDGSGNMYYKYMARNDNGKLVERREVSFPSGVAGMYDSMNLVPPQWRSWLTGGRPSPPSEGEIEQASLQQQIVQQRAAAIKAAEARARALREAMGTSKQAGGPDVGAFTGQLRDRGMGGGHVHSGGCCDGHHDHDHSHGHGHSHSHGPPTEEPKTGNGVGTWTPGGPGGR